MPLYYFKLVDSIMVADHGVHELSDETAARDAARELARSLRETDLSWLASTVPFW